MRQKGKATRDDYREAAAAPATKAPTRTIQLAPMLARGEAELGEEVVLGLVLGLAVVPDGLTVMIEEVMVPVGFVEPVDVAVEGRVPVGVPELGELVLVELLPPATIWPSSERYEGGAL